MCGVFLKHFMIGWDNINCEPLNQSQQSNNDLQFMTSIHRIDGPTQCEPQPNTSTSFQRNKNQKSCLVLILLLAWYLRTCVQAYTPSFSPQKLGIEEGGSCIVSVEHSPNVHPWLAHVFAFEELMKKYPVVHQMCLLKSNNDNKQPLQTKSSVKRTGIV